MATGTSTSAAPATRMDPHTARRGMFVTKDGRNVLFTFLLLIFLFALWGFCNGMIDVMDKHFQEELHLSLAQSAWVQFAHYLGYFLMALRAGWRLGWVTKVALSLVSSWLRWADSGSSRRRTLPPSGHSCSAFASLLPA